MATDDKNVTREELIKHLANFTEQKASVLLKQNATDWQKKCRQLRLPKRRQWHANMPKNIMQIEACSTPFKPSQYAALQ